MARIRRRSTASQFVSIGNLDDLQGDMKQLASGIRRLPVAVGKRAVSSAVTRGTASFFETARSATPRRTGMMASLLQKKVHHRLVGGKAGFFSLRIGFDKRKSFYAVMVEEGTKKRFRRTGAVLRSASGRIQPTNFFKNIFRQHAPAMARNIAVELRKGFERAAKKYLPNAR